MNNTSAFERFLERTPSTHAQALQDLQTNAACALCAIAGLLENQKNPLEADALAEVGQLIRELASMGAVQLFAPAIRD